MIYRLEIENFYSIKDAQVLDLTIAANVPDEDGRFHPIFEGSDLRVPKVVAIYGANASGKTTVLRALDFLGRFVAYSANPSLRRNVIFAFNDQDAKERPTRFVIELGGVMNPSWESEGTRPEFGTLRYELVVQVKDGDVDRVISESLSQRPSGKGKWIRVFERQADGRISDSSTFKISGFRHLQNTLASNASIISSFAYFNHSSAAFYADLAQRILTNIASFSNNDAALLRYLNQSPEIMERLNRDLARIDVGIEEFHIDEMPGQTLHARFRHSGHAADLPWELESQGTQAFVRLFPILTLALENGGVALVDEFDTLIHPLVLPEILRWFYDDEIRNAEGGQIWMSCHAATLLEYLTKEEVIISEKDSIGRTRVFSLMDIGSQDTKNSVRRSANLYKKYLSGAFGGVPVIG